jgi:hypothetical protein
MNGELKHTVVAAEIREESERSIQDMLVRSGVAGAISLIPCGVGATINEMLTQLAVRRTNERMKEMFDQMAERISKLGDENINRGWFRGEEFQTLLFETIHQLHVTQDKTKIEMLGKALANSGATEFKEETRKQLFVQLVRELTPQHISSLRQLSPRPKPEKDFPDWWAWNNRPNILGRGNDLLILQMLAANGLVVENLKSTVARQPSVSRYASIGEIDKALNDFIKDLQKPPMRYFCLSDLGMDFLKFVGLVPEKEVEQPLA